MAHEGWPVQTIDDQFDVLCVEVGWLAENLALRAGLRHAINLSVSVLLERLLHHYLSIYPVGI
jgi:hypothetical protein